MDIKMSGRVMEIELFRFLFSVMILFDMQNICWGKICCFPVPLLVLSFSS